MKAATIALLIICLGLGIGLLVRHNKASAKAESDETKIKTLTSVLEETQTKLDEQKKVNTELETNLFARVEQVKFLLNNLDKVQNDAAAAAQAAQQQQARLKADLDAKEKAFQAELAKKDARIAELQTDKDDLGRKIEGLNSLVKGLEKNIAETQRKLANSEGDRDFLLKELKQMQMEKAELERQINDLAFLREQVSQLKEELSVARRLEWIRRGIYGAAEQKKGAQLLQQGFVKPPPPADVSLDVEIRREGDATVVTPTNAPPRQ